MPRLKRINACDQDPTVEFERAVLSTPSLGEVSYHATFAGWVFQRFDVLRFPFDRQEIQLAVNHDSELMPEFWVKCE